MSKKFLVLLIDGAGDYPLPELGGKTPLEVARTRIWTNFANGRIGMVKTIPDGLPQAVMLPISTCWGYDPRRYYTGVWLLRREHRC